MSNEMAIVVGSGLFTKVNGQTPEQAVDAACLRRFTAEAKKRRTTCRTKLVRKVNAKIAEHSYENDLKLSVAVDRLLTVLNEQ